MTDSEKASLNAEPSSPHDFSRRCCISGLA